MKSDTSFTSQGPTPAGLLLLANGPGETKAMLGIGPAPGLTPRFLRELSAQDLELYRTRNCSLTTEVARASNRRVLSCGALTADSVHNRAAVIFQYDVEAAHGDQYHTYMIQVPTTDAIVTLTLASRPDALHRNALLFRRIWRSLIVPDTVN